MSADLLQPATLRQLPTDISHVVYAAAPDARTPQAYRDAYLLGLDNLLDALPRLSRLERCVLIGSTAVWGASEDEVTEDTPPNPEDFNGEIILQAEDLLHQQLPGLGTALRLSGIYGPGRTQLLDRLREGKIQAPLGPGHFANRIHVQDAASACLHLLGLNDASPCYIGTDGHPLETAHLYDALAAKLGVPPPARRPVAPSGKRLSNRRLRESGWEPAWPNAIQGYQALIDAGA
jgi:nucleoside-diphosphate-sugar epimerase